jgi:hypothetical protein
MKYRRLVPIEWNRRKRSAHDNDGKPDFIEHELRHDPTGTLRMYLELADVALEDDESTNEEEVAS